MNLIYHNKEQDSLTSPNILIEYILVQDTNRFYDSFLLNFLLNQSEKKTVFEKDK